MVDSIKQLKKKRVMHPNSLANLRPASWKPGESGNKQGYSLKSRLDDAMGKPLIKPSENASAGEVLVYSTLEGAILREPTPLREVWDRTEGKVPEKHAILQDVTIRFIVGQGYEKVEDATE